MVAPNNENKLQGLDGVICPICFKPVPPEMMGTEQVEGGILRREYYSICPTCGVRHVVQYFCGETNRWFIERHIALKPLYLPYGQWAYICKARPLAAEKSPVIQTGPGGDYQKTVSPEELQGTINMLKQTVIQVGESLLNLRDEIGKISDKIL
jgi:hypothetical protein